MAHQPKVWEVFFLGKKERKKADNNNNKMPKLLQPTLRQRSDLGQEVFVNGYKQWLVRLKNKPDGLLPNGSFIQLPRHSQFSYLAWRELSNLSIQLESPLAMIKGWLENLIETQEYHLNTYEN